MGITGPRLRQFSLVAIGEIWALSLEPSLSKWRIRPWKNRPINPRRPATSYSLAPVTRSPRSEQGRDANRRATEGSPFNLRHGLRSTQLLEQPAVAEWHGEQVAAITNDLGGAEELTVLARTSVREAARLEVIL